MPESAYDAIIIGGGPGGSTAAGLLARQHRRVLLLEREHFPRFHIGESLLPYNQRLFKELGVDRAIQTAGFPVKRGAQFHLGNASKSLKLVFARGRFTRETTAFQVERATFDLILLKHAQECGAEVKQGANVTSFSREPDAVQVEVRQGSHPVGTFRGKFLIDASGRGNFTGNLEGLRVVHPKLKKIAVFGHFANVTRDGGLAAADTIIVRLEDKWFWIIPITGEKTSVGCVMDRDEYAAAAAGPAEIFDRLWRSSPAMVARMEHSVPLNTIQTTADFSYYNRRLASPRLLRVGDAAGFMDPIFSAGVYLAMYSGKLAADVVYQAIAADDDGGRRLANYEKEVFRAMRYYWEMVEGFYTRPFVELFMEPRPKLNLPDAITAILAGELHGGWPMRWRRLCFLALVKAQKYFPLVPRIRWD